ncbi:MAG TPA: hypothetical protein VF516_14620 [Kofleriaceae bacterium]
MLRDANDRNSWTTTSTATARLRARVRPPSSAHANTPNVTAVCSAPVTASSRHSARPRIGSAGGRGGRRMTSASGGSTTSASAGRPSVTRLIHNSWSGNSGSGSPASAAISITASSAVLPDSR